MIRSIFQIYYLVSIFHYGNNDWKMKPILYNVTCQTNGQDWKSIKNICSLLSDINFSLWENILENKPNLYNSTLQTNDQYWKTMEMFFDQNIRKDILYELKYIIF